MYRLFFRTVILRMRPETAHRLGLAAIRWLWPAVRLLRGSRWFPKADQAGAVRAMGLVFPSSLGLAAGMDKNGTSIRGMRELGFGYVEIGTVTAHPQPGNERPRLWRELDVRGLRNRMGFNNQGATVVAERLRRLRETKAGKQLIVGVNIGKSAITPLDRAAEDYEASALSLAPYADYLVVNVSSPNTPGLRDLQNVDALFPIVLRVRRAADAVTRQRVPLLVKIAPDLADDDVDAVADLVKQLRVDGVVATNTTINHDRGPGGVSGPPVRDRAVEVVTRLRERLGTKATIIGVGGIETAADAQALLDAGANLLQGYTGLVYGGPAWAARINAELARHFAGR